RGDLDALGFDVCKVAAVLDFKTAGVRMAAAAKVLGQLVGDGVALVGADFGGDAVARPVGFKGDGDVCAGGHAHVVQHEHGGVVLGAVALDFFPGDGDDGDLVVVEIFDALQQLAFVADKLRV